MAALSCTHGQLSKISQRFLSTRPQSYAGIKSSLYHICLKVSWGAEVQLLPGVPSHSASVTQALT